MPAYIVVSSYSEVSVHGNFVEIRALSKTTLKNININITLVLDKQIIKIIKGKIIVSFWEN